MSDPLYVGKTLGYSYSPGSDLYFDEITKIQYENLVAIAQERAKRKLSFYCRSNSQLFKVILEKGIKKYIRRVFLFDDVTRQFMLANSYLEVVYGETEREV